MAPYRAAIVYQGGVPIPPALKNAAQGRYERLILRDRPDSHATGTLGTCRANQLGIAGASRLGFMVPQRLAAHRPRAASQAERERDQNSRYRFDEAARRQEHEQRGQRGQQRGGQGSAMPPPEAVVFDVDEQVEHGVDRQPGQRRADAERVDVDLRERGRRTSSSC